MWVVENHTSFSADRNWYLDKNGAKSWVVAVKAAYDVLPDGSTAIAKNQEPVLLTEEFRGKPGESGVLYDADLGGPKSVTDILLNGHAYAPAGGMATAIEVELNVGPMRKTLHVSGNRQWDSFLLGGMMLSHPEPFDRIPICYERAFGGVDTKSQDPREHSFEERNPIGTGFAGIQGHLAGQLAPNVEYSADRMSSWKDRPRPAGFSSIYSYWLPRRKYAGTYDEKWMKERFPLWPEDFDERFYHSAPQDQQIIGYLRGGETVRLRNLTPGGYLEFALPRFYPTFKTIFRGREVEHRAKLHTLILEPDAPRLLMVWYTRLPVQRGADDLDKTVVSEKRFLD